MRKYKRTYKKAVIIFAVISAGIILRWRLPSVDAGIFRIFNNYHFSWLDTIMLPVTYCGNAVILLIAVAGIWLMKGKRLALQALLSIIAAGILVTVIKRMFPASRPLAALPAVNMLGPLLRLYSFPSGHTAAIFSLTVLVRQRFVKLAPLFWVVAIMVAVSRIYVGAHFPSDVISGAGIGYLAGVLMLMVNNKEKGDS